MKTQEELNALKEEIETLSRKLKELTDEELAQVAGGIFYRGHYSAQEKTFTTAYRAPSRKPR